MHPIAEDLPTKTSKEFKGKSWENVLLYALVLVRTESKINRIYNLNRLSFLVSTFFWFVCKKKSKLGRVLAFGEEGSRTELFECFPFGLSNLIVMAACFCQKYFVYFDDHFEQDLFWTFFLFVQNRIEMGNLFPPPLSAFPHVDTCIEFFVFLLPIRDFFIVSLCSRTRAKKQEFYCKLWNLTRFMFS